MDSFLEFSVLFEVIKHYVLFSIYINICICLASIHIDKNTKTKEQVRRMAPEIAQLVKHLASVRKARVQLLTFYKLGRVTHT